MTVNVPIDFAERPPINASRCDCFAGQEVPSTQRSVSADSLEGSQIPPRAVIFGQGTRSDGVFKVVDGCVMTFLNLPDDRQLVLDFVGPGQHFGFPHGVRAPVSAQALELTTIRREYRAEQMCEQHLEWSNAYLLAQIEGLHRKVEGLRGLSALQRVAHFLEDFARARNTRTLELPMSRAEMGSALGLTVETVARMLTKLKDMKIIRYDSGDPYKICLGRQILCPDGSVAPRLPRDAKRSSGRAQDKAQRP